MPLERPRGHAEQRDPTQLDLYILELQLLLFLPVKSSRMVLNTTTWSKQRFEAYYGQYASLTCHIQLLGKHCARCMTRQRQRYLYEVRWQHARCDVQERLLCSGVHARVRPNHVLIAGGPRVAADGHA